MMGLLADVVGEHARPEGGLVRLLLDGRRRADDSLRCHDPQSRAALSRLAPAAPAAASPQSRPAPPGGRNPALQPRALYAHYYGHSLNLACQDVIRAIKPIKNALDTAFELSKLLKYSSKRNAEFKNIHAEIASEQSGFRTLCPTRWTVRASSMNSIHQNYTVIQKGLDSFADSASRDPEMSARCTDVATQFEQFNFLFGVALGEKLLNVADNL